MQKLVFTFLLIVLFPELSQAQRIEIFGILNDKIGPVADAHIVNKTSNEGTFSRGNGKFSIHIKPGDFIEITTVQHHTKIFEFQKDLLHDKKLEIFLYIKDYLLEEVTIQKTDLSGIISNDAKRIQKSDHQKLMEQLGFNPFPKKTSKIDREIFTAYGGGIKLGLGTMVSLDYIINSISGRIDLLEKQRKILENEKKLKYIENTFKYYIVKSLKIDSSHVSRFIYISHFDKKFEESFKGGDLKIIQFLKEQAVLFKKDSL